LAQAARIHDGTRVLPRRMEPPEPGP